MTSGVRYALWDALARSPESFQFTRDGAQRGAGDAGGYILLLLLTLLRRK